jgi:hypothetical protein
MKHNQTSGYILRVLSGLFLLSNIYSQTIEANFNEISKLEMILNKCAEYCAKLNDASLSFSCRERIVEKKMLLPPRAEEKFKSDLWGYQTIQPLGLSLKKGKNIYVFDYQLVRNNYNTEEHRALLEHNGQKKHQNDVQLKTKFYTYENILFGPIGLLSESQQQDYNYKIIKEESYKGESTYIIEVTPLSSQTSRILDGRIWITKSDLSILKIEWEQKSVKNYQETEVIGLSLRATPKLNLSAEYDYHKNGIRFPSKFSFKEVYIIKRREGRTNYLRTDLSIEYNNYKFIEVEIDVSF